MKVSFCFLRDSAEQGTYNAPATTPSDSQTRYCVPQRQLLAHRPLDVDPVGGICFHPDCPAGPMCLAEKKTPQKQSLTERTKEACISAQLVAGGCKLREDPIYANTRPVANKQPSPRPAMPVGNLKTASSSQNLRNPSPGRRYDDGKQRYKH
ncbi:uncharacterized protein LOC116063511 isoform X3 [Sander lucioperca]|uniref:uncharacterized protein LOC116063511 isoform X3 n=1 Tax=Sander lucioperca TaxID=283035 RepID=UPI001653D907|nr:uncharacterized protein LOC116063511 isoform X3 [Sander lucioperca]